MQKHIEKGLSQHYGFCTNFNETSYSLRNQHKHFYTSVVVFKMQRKDHFFVLKSVPRGTRIGLVKIIS